ncbi:Protein fmp52, mitochondrial, partial [Tulasnella sp. 403]
MTSQITGKTALLLGATGATGHHTLRYLLASPKFSRVVEVGRRVTPADKLEEYGFKQDGAERRKLVQKVVDFEKLRTAMLQPESAGESEKTEVEKLREEKADVVI